MTHILISARLYCILSNTHFHVENRIFCLPHHHGDLKEFLVVSRIFGTHEVGLITKISLDLSFDFRQWCVQTICHQKVKWLECLNEHSFAWLLSLSSRETRSSIAEQLKSHSHPYWCFWKSCCLPVLAWFHPIVQFATLRDLSEDFSSSSLFSNTWWSGASHSFNSYSSVSHQLSPPSLSPQGRGPLKFLVLFFSYAFTWFCLTEPRNWAGKERRLFLK